MNCCRGTICRCHCGSLLIFNKDGKVEATDSSRCSVQQLCIFYSASLYLNVTYYICGITFKGPYYSCGKMFYHICDRITFVKVFTFRGADSMLDDFLIHVPVNRIDKEGI